MVDFTFVFDHYFSFVQGRTFRANAAHCVKTIYARTSLFRDYFFNRIAIIWNGIPEDIKVATTLCSFKRQLKSFYFKRLYNVFGGVFQDYLSQVSPCKYFESLLLLVSL